MTPLTLARRLWAWLWERVDATVCRLGNEMGGED